MAETLEFRIPAKAYCLPDCPFSKALAAVYIIEDTMKTVHDKISLIQLWRNAGLITEDECLSLHQFYGVCP